jgi:hypothetical protein
MSVRAIRITSRIVFFVCGLISLFTAVPFAMLRGADLPVQSEWIIFVAFLALVGLVTMTVAVLPRSWIAKACEKDQEDKQLFLGLLKWLGGFAGISYLVALVAFLAPHQWDLDPQLMFSLCPLYFVRMTFDPSPMATFFLLAPMNAAVYGSLGFTLRCAWLAFGKRTRTENSRNREVGGD